MRGYSDTKPDGNPARSAQSLRRQFGENYDVNLDRNRYDVSLGKSTMGIWTATQDILMLFPCILYILLLKITGHGERDAHMGQSLHFSR